MPWVKKNLLFVVASGVALVLLVLAGLYALSKRGEDTTVQEQLEAQAQEYQSLNSASPFPSAENIAALKQEQQRVKDFQKQFGSIFVPAPAYPKLDDQGFKAHLEQTIAQMTAVANSANVALPPRFSFTFSNHRTQFQFGAGSVESWMPQIADIRSICDVLFQARINALDGLQRVPVVPRIDVGNAEYLAGAIITNQMGTFAPYSISFRSFSGELAAVLEGMSRSTNFMIVKSVTIAPSEVPLGPEPGATGVVAPQPVYQRRIATPQYREPAAVDDLSIYAERSGKGGGGAPAPRPVARPVAVMPRMAAPAQATTVLYEQPLQVTMLVEIVKLKRQQ